VPSSGQPIVLTADRQTTGGYPKIATVASADLARLVQTPSGAAIRMQRISRDQAEELWISEQANLQSVLESLQTAERADAEN
jgi:allophanate hydrolase